jgi:hypothetical protein
MCYNLICIFICTPICTKKIILAKSGCDKEHVIHRFEIPQTIMTDGGSVFISEEFKKFATDVGIKLIRSSPYYAQEMDKPRRPIRALSS